MAQKERFRLLVNRKSPDVTETPAADKGKSFMDGHEKFYVIEGGMKKLIIIACLLLSGCAATWTQEGAGPYPDNYKEVVANHIKQTYFDPYSLKDVQISEPTPGVLAMAQGYNVCLQANAKNRMGGYTGLKRNSYLINNQRVIFTINDDLRCYNNAPYNVLYPWPEMEGK